MASECWKSSKICLTELAVFSSSSTFTCLADKLTRVIAYCNVMVSECWKSSKICLIELVVFSSSSTISCLADKFTKAIA